MAAMSTTQVANRMALAQPTRSLRSSASSSRVFGVAPLPPRCLPSFRCVAQAQQTSSSAPDLQESISRAAAFSTAAVTLLAAGNAQAATEIAQLAASDNRISVIATLFLPVVGWVLFNIGGPALNQLNNAANKQGKTPGFKKAQKAISKPFSKKRAAIGAVVGLSAASLLAAAPQADAAQELMQLSAVGDNRFGIIATLFLPVIGWVAFNIGGPALNQLANTGKAATLTRKVR